MKNNSGYIGKVILILLVIILAVGAAVYIKERSTPESSETNEKTPVELGGEVTAGPKVTPQKVKVNVYFGNSKLNPNSLDCQKVFPVQREVFQGNEVIGAIDQLFSGPTADELKQGYTSFFSTKTKNINQGTFVKNGILYINLSDIRKIIPNVNTSCGIAHFFAEVGSTVTQFPGIKDIVYAIESNPKTFYDWMQIGCAPGANYCDATPFLTK